MGCIVSCFTCCGLFSSIADEVTCMNQGYQPKMEPEYHHVLKFKGEKAVWYKPPKSKLDIAQLKYKEDLASGKVVYHHDWIEDFHLFARNAHLYFSPWTASRIHPFSRAERLTVVCLSIAMSLCLAIWTAANIARIRQDNNDDDDEEKNTKAKIRNIKVFYGILNPILLFIFTSILSSFALCSCAQGPNCAACRTKCEQIAHCSMCLFSVIVMYIVVFYAVYGIQDTNLNVLDVIIDFSLTVILSTLVITPLSVLIQYEWNRRSDLKSYQKSLKRKSDGKKPKFKYNIPYSWYLEWSEAGKPRFQGDGLLTQKDKDKANGRWLTGAKRLTNSLRMKSVPNEMEFEVANSNEHLPTLMPMMQSPLQSQSMSMTPQYQHSSGSRGFRTLSAPMQPHSFQQPTMSNSVSVQNAALYHHSSSTVMMMTPSSPASPAMIHRPQSVPMQVTAVPSQAAGMSPVSPVWVAPHATVGVVYPPQQAPLSTVSYMQPR